MEEAILKVTTASEALKICQASGAANCSVEDLNVREANRLKLELDRS